MNDKRDIIPDNGIYNEVSHYKVIKKLMDGEVVLKHYESGDELIITEEYINKYMYSADITKESKWVSKTEMQEIFNHIPVGDVFTVAFIKKPKELSSREYSKKVKEVKDELVGIIKSNKIKDPEYIIEFAWSHMVSKEIPLEERVLRGYKNNNVSINGLYSVKDMDIDENRTVNIRTIKSLIYKGTNYLLSFR